MTNQVICVAHNAGPFNRDSFQKQEHEKLFKKCQWVVYVPEDYPQEYYQFQLQENKLGTLEEINLGVRN